MYERTQLTSESITSCIPIDETTWPYINAYGSSLVPMGGGWIYCSGPANQPTLLFL